MKAEKALIKILKKLEDLEEKIDAIANNLGLEFEPKPLVAESPAPNKKPSLTREELSLIEGEAEVVEEPVEALTAAEGDPDEAEDGVEYPKIKN